MKEYVKVTQDIPGIQANLLKTRETPPPPPPQQQQQQTNKQKQTNKKKEKGQGHALRIIYSGYWQADWPVERQLSIINGVRQSSVNQLKKTDVDWWS